MREIATMSTAAKVIVAEAKWIFGNIFVMILLVVPDGTIHSLVFVSKVIRKKYSIRRSIKKKMTHI